MTDSVLKCTISVRGIPHGPNGKASVRDLVSEQIEHDAQKIKPVENSDDKWIVLLSSEQHKQDILSRCGREAFVSLNHSSVTIEEVLVEDIPQSWRDEEEQRVQKIDQLPDKQDILSRCGREAFVSLNHSSVTIEEVLVEDIPQSWRDEEEQGVQKIDQLPDKQDILSRCGGEAIVSLNHSSVTIEEVLVEDIPQSWRDEENKRQTEESITSLVPDESYDYPDRGDLGNHQEKDYMSFISESYNKPTETHAWDFSKRANQGTVPQTHPTSRFNPEDIYKKEDIQGTRPAFDTIKVHLAPDSCSEAVRFHFKNPMNGGGDIKYFMPKNDCILITFVESKVAEMVVSKDHVIEGKPVIVSVITTHPFYDNKVAIKNIKPGTTEEMVKNVLECSTKCEVNLVQLDSVNNTAVAQFDRPNPGIEELCKLCSGTDSKDILGNVSKLPISNALIVKGFTKKPVLDVLKYYFQTKESGNTNDLPIDHVELASDSSNDCLVFFSDYTGIENITQKQKHKIGDSVVSVTEYHECFHMDDHATVTGTTENMSFQLKSLEQLKKRFMQKSPQIKKQIEEKLKEIDVELNWNNDEPDCVVFKHGGRARAPWQKHATKEFKMVYDQLTMTEIPIHDEMWNDTFSKLKTIKGQNHNEAKLYLKKPLVIVVGFTEYTDKLVEQIKTFIDEVLKEKKKNVVKDTNLNDWQIQLLEASAFFKKMHDNYHGLKITQDLTKHHVCFEGPSESICPAQIKMYELLNSTVNAELTMFSEQQLHLLNEDPVKSSIASKLNGQGVISVYTVNTSHISVYSLTQDGLDIAVQILKQAVNETIISIDEVSQSLISSSRWSDFMDKMQMEHSRKVLIKPFLNKMQVVIAATDDICDTVTMKVKTFIDEHCEHKSILPFEKGVQNFLQRNKKEDISKICDKNNVNISYTENGTEFVLSGHKNGLDQADQDLRNLAEEVIIHKEKLQMPGIESFIVSEKGKMIITYIENTKKCVIQKEQPIVSQDPVKETATYQRSQVNIVASANLSPTTKIYVAHGDLTELKVDIIVNAATVDLCHSEGLAKHIVQKGGQSIQDECDQYKDTNGPLLEGECMISGPGRLNCKAVAHVVGPRWKGQSNSKDEELLIEAVLKGLEACETKSHTSIVIPAISTGIFGYPVKEACHAIVISITKYFTVKTNSQIQDVYLCDIKDQSVDSFVDAAKAIIGEDNLQIQTTTGKYATTITCSASPHELTLPVTSAKAGVMKLIQGEIAKQTADIIVSSVGSDLNLEAGKISKTILDEGGNEIKKDLRTKYSKGISEGEIAVTCPGRLQCKKIYHFCLSRWNPIQEKNLASMIEWSLKEAVLHGCRSIAFPAIGTGILGYPKDVVARVLTDTINGFINKSPMTSLKEVQLVVYPKDTAVLKAFENVQNFPKSDGSGRWHARSFQGRTESLHDEVSQLDVTQGIQIGNLTVCVKKGDITLENTECIVCTINRKLDLSYGMLSQALLKMHGAELEKELLKEVDTMKKDAIAVTNVCLQGKIQTIIFINTEFQDNKWEKHIEKVFKKTKELNVSSLGIPSIGTGNQKLSKSTFAKYIFAAIVKHKDAKYLKEVVVVTIDDGTQNEVSSAILANALEYNKSKTTKQNPCPVRSNPVSSNPIELNKSEMGVMLYIYADNKEIIQQTCCSLHDVMKKELKVSTIEHEQVKGLSEEKIEKILQIPKTSDVLLEVNTRIGRIKIKGLHHDEVEEVMKRVFHIIVEHVESEKADILKNTIQWYYFVVDDNYQKTKVPYIPEINLKIETAWKEGKMLVDITDDEGIVYQINFDDNTEYPKDNRNETVQVLRKDQIKDAGVDLPSYWDPMYTTESELKIVPLRLQSTEYLQVDQMFAPTNKTIIKIERIQNKTLFQQVAAMKRLIEKTKPSTGTSRQLWHGTSSSALSSINMHGFNHSFCGKNATAYGNGVYFASDPKYSAQEKYSPADSQGNRYMYLVEVLTGEFTQGKSGMRVPPPKSGASSNILYDSVVENPTNPNIFVIFKDTQAYPQYLITYK